MTADLASSLPDLERLADDLDVVRDRALAGPNRWRREPVVTGDVVPGALVEHPALLREACARLRADVPELPDPPPSSSDEGAAWTDSLAALAIALQRRAGSAVADWRAVAEGDDPGSWAFAIGYEEEEVGLASVFAAARLLRRAVRGDSLRVADVVEDLRDRRAEEALGPRAAAIVAEARRRGIPVQRMPGERTVRLGHGIHAHRIDDSADDAPGDAAAIVEGLFPPGAPSRVPIVAVTGTNGKTTTTRLVAHLLRAAGHEVGFTTTDGVYVGGEMIFEGDMTGPMAADMVLSHPQVDAAVLETARGGILRAGLGYDACDVAVVLNVSADHLGLRGIHTVDQLADVKAVVVSAARDDGHVVLNADDPLVLAMRDRTAAGVVLFSSRALAASAPAAAHVRAGGMAVTLEEAAGRESFVLHRGAEHTVLAAVADVPMTDGGAARFQVANAAAASAAAWALGIAPDVIREGLVRFVPSIRMTPGRMNVVRVRGATIIVDYAHNPAAIRALLDYAHRVDAQRRIAVLSIPGDRRDEDIRELGGLGAGVDEVIYLENADYRRGREVGETGALMIEGLVQAGGDASRAMVVHDQPAAVDEVLRRLRAGDLVLFIADYAAPAIARFEESG